MPIENLMAAHRTKALEHLADELTRRLSIPFVAGAKGTITFSSRLRITDWAVPLIFDGHAAREREALIPTDFVGHALWPALTAAVDCAGERAWWTCTMTAHAARAILDTLQDEDEHPLDEGVWKIGRDVLLEDFAPARPRAARRRRAAAAA